jgi:hypothetical protein
MKLRLLALMILIGVTLAGPGRARSLDAPEPPWKSRMRQEGWRDVQEGVLRREAGGGRMETFTYGEAGRRWTVRRLEERIRSLQRESERYPSADLARILKTLRRELKQATAELKGSIPEPLGEKSGCDPGFAVQAAADPLWTSAPGVQASASAFFHSPCSDPGNSYAYAYARASVGNTMTIRSQEDPESGAWVDSTAAASVSGSSSCYSEAYARSWSSTTAFSYEVSDTNYACPSQTPYQGTPRVVPGLIQAIDFDNGGEGISYHELTPVSNPDYRDTEVDHYESIVMGLDDGEWLEYTIDVARTGTYALVAQTAANGYTGTFHVEVDGTDVTGPITVPDVGYWSSPTKTGLSLTAGLHVLRFAVDQGFEAFQTFRLVDSSTPQTPRLGAPFQIPGTIHAIDFDEGGEGISYHEITPVSNPDYRDTEVDHYGYWISRLENGEWLEYTIDVARTGAYTLVAQTRSNGHSGSLHVEIDGTDVTGPVTVPDTGEYTPWGSPMRPGVSLTAGRHVLRFVADQGIDLFHSLRIVDASKAQTPFGGVARTLPGTLKMVEFDEGGEQVAYHDTSADCEGDCSYRPVDDVDRYGEIIDLTGGGEWWEYTVDVTATGTYQLSMQVSAENGGATFHVEVNGVDVTGPMIMPTTGSWATFQTVTRTGVSLTAGRKVLRVVIDDGAGNYDAGSFYTLTLQP